MKIVVIGSKGFVGSACCAYFSRAHEVMGADIHPDNAESYFRITNADSLVQLFQKFSFDVCINASGSANVGFSFSNRDKDYELNAGNVQTMLEAISLYQPSCRFLNFSSAAVYGNPAALPINEEFETKPLSPYGEHKLLSEQILKRACSEMKLSTVSLRVFSAYGPGLHKQLFWDIYKKWQNSNSVTLFGTGKESRDFIYINDLVHAVECVIRGAAFQGEVVNVASGSETTIREAATTFLDELKSPYELQFSGEEKPGDPINWRADITRLKVLGFEPEFDLRLGLRLTAADYLQVNH